MAFKASDIVADMIAAAKDSFADDWPKAQDFAKIELKKLAQSLVDITKLTAQGKLNVQQAKALLAIHRNATLTVLLTIQGLGLIAVENALNAALRVARDAVNAAAGLTIL